MRVLFHPGQIGWQPNTRSSVTLPHMTARREPSVRSIRDIEKVEPLASDNPGNMVHMEAPARLLRHDEEASLHANLWQLLSRFEGDQRSLAREIRRNFDLVVISEANIIRKNTEHGYRLVELLGSLLRLVDLPIVVLGVGIQHEMPGTIGGVDPRLDAYIDTLAAMAEVFGVRGQMTERYLHSVGHSKAVALGCPSIFVDPSQILQMKAPALEAHSPLAAAGYYDRASLARSDRFSYRAVEAVAQCYPTSYVFQNDIMSFYHADGPYDGGSGEVDRVAVIDELRSHSTDTSIRSFHYFYDLAKWRAFLASRAAYVGDRLHCGIAALQAGAPSIILRPDYRVQEIVEYFDIPTMAPWDFMETDPRKSIADLLSPERLSMFKATYVSRLEHFREVMATTSTPMVARGAA